MQLILSRLSFHVTSGPVFDQVSASLPQASKVALIGPNGAGKSTLMHIIAGKLSPSSGHLVQPFAPVVHIDQPEAEDNSWGEALWERLRMALVDPPGLLLLDEPTRHLDQRHRRELAEWLRTLRPTSMLIISHDLEFLDSLATHTWHLEHGRLQSMPGTPSVHLAEAHQNALAYRERYQQQQRALGQLEQDIAKTKEQARHTERHNHDSSQRRLAKKVAKKAVSREKRLEHFRSSDQYLEAPRDPHILRYTWDHVPIIKGSLLRVEQGSLGHEHDVLTHLFLEVKAGDRIAISGDNGAGKSTLLQGLFRPEGLRREGYFRRIEAPVSFMPQVLDSPSSTSLWQYFSHRATLSLGLGRAWLASYGFDHDAWDKTLNVLSHGERVKLEIATMAAEGAPVLVLDEPEHHLDWPSLETISRGLVSYPGTLLVISHVPRFLSSLHPTQRWDVTGGEVLVSSSAQET